ncbi:hypothetical protein [Streptomyces sp. NPDC048438]|uniref:hypothetical protein n=1 Tax=Streptomyces sp. NPDC048438 TaxID=3365551 RepID=UPI0037182DB7
MCLASFPLRIHCSLTSHSASVIITMSPRRRPSELNSSSSHSDGRRERGPELGTAPEEVLGEVEDVGEVARLGVRDTAHLHGGGRGEQDPGHRQRPYDVVLLVEQP